MGHSFHSPRHVARAVLGDGEGEMAVGRLVDAEKQRVIDGQPELRKLVEREPGQRGCRTFGIGTNHRLQIGEQEEARAGSVLLGLDEVRVAALQCKPIEHQRGTEGGHRGGLPAGQARLSTARMAAQRIVPTDAAQ